MCMRSFASDNNSGVHPLVMEALDRANRDHAVGYGDDPWTEEAVRKIREVFTPDCEPLFVFNGTGSNAVALQLCTRPYNSILCAETAHIYVDECGAPARMTGCQIRPIATPDGKLTPELIRPYLCHFGEQHHSQPGAIYISQCSELGTVYKPEEIKALTSLAHQHGMYVHMDGARLANACAALNLSFRELTADCGICPQLRRNQERVDAGRERDCLQSCLEEGGLFCAQAVGAACLQTSLPLLPVYCLSDRRPLAEERHACQPHGADSL